MGRCHTCADSQLEDDVRGAHLFGQSADGMEQVATLHLHLHYAQQSAGPQTIIKTQILALYICLVGYARGTILPIGVLAGFSATITLCKRRFVCRSRQSLIYRPRLVLERTAGPLYDGREHRY